MAASRAATHGFAFGSGLAALDTVLKLLRAGDHVVCGENVYGGSHRLMERVYSRVRRCASPSWTCATSRTSNAAITPATRMVYCETPTNPMMYLTDLARGGRPAPGARLPLRGRQHLRDARSSSGRSSSAPTSCSTRPPSTSTATATWSAALLVTSRDDLAERLGFLQNAAGARARADGLLARAPRHQDAAAAHAPARRQRPRGRAVARGAPGRAAGLLPRPPVASPARARHAGR